MGEHYFSQAPSSAHEARVFSFAYRGRSLAFETDAGVFSKAHVDKGTALLLEALPERFTGRALDLGCGWGAMGVCMAAAWPEADVNLTDINGRAVAIARENLARNRLAAIVTQGDGLSGLEGRFGLIATNPPIRAGKDAVYRLFQESVERLDGEGEFYIVIRKQQGADSALKFLRGLMDEVEVVSRGGGGYRVLRGR